MNSQQSVRHPAGVISSTALAGGRTYSLHSELVKLSLPSATRDPNRWLAWVNSICFLFLLVGAVGIKAPEVVFRPPPELVELVPVVFTPPADPPQNEPVPDVQVVQPEEDLPVEAPQVATVVAAEDTVQFAVPVEGPVILAPSPLYVPPPPRELPKPTSDPTPPTPVRFRPGTDGGRYPQPSYPRAALLAGEQGRVMVLIVVDPTGAVASTSVKDSSGYSTLDTHAARWVKSRWQFPPGATRYYECEIIFQIK